MEIFTLWIIFSKHLEKGTFISSVTGYPEEEYYLGKNVWSGNALDWGQRFEVGDVIADPSGSWEPSSAQQYIDQQITTESTIRLEQDVYTRSLIPLADEEDITKSEQHLKFKNRVYSPINPNGMGYVYIEKEDNFKTVVESVTQGNTIFVIRYDYNLGGETVTIPENCMLKFEGGSLRNGTIEGYILNDYLRPEWFGAKKDGVTDDTWAIQTCIDLMNVYGGTVKLNRGVYRISSVTLKTKITFKGCGIGATIIESNTGSEKGIINVASNSIQCVISDMSVIGSKPYNGFEPLVYDDSEIQDGIFVDTVEGIYNATYPMAYYLQENTGIVNNKQTYRNLTIENVYVGRCRYGINMGFGDVNGNNRAYRTIIQKCDVKRCVYGIKFSCTDSDMHNIYIERCDKSRLISRGSNNNITDVKSIWNGIAEPYNSFGLELRGNRNRYINLEAQDNYCSGIASSGNENIYSNILANGDGYAYNAELDVENDGLCEWYVNTLTSVYNNCTITNYSIRQAAETQFEKPFPKYPIKYSADGIGTNQNIDIVASNASTTIIAREPINIPDIIPTSDIFDIFPASVIGNEYGYKINANTDTFYKSKILQRSILTSGQITIVFEFTIGDQAHTGNIVCSVGNYYINVSPSRNISFVYGNSVIENEKGDRAVFSLPEGTNLSKPIRIVATFTPREKVIRTETIGEDEVVKTYWKYDCELNAWYYGTFNLKYGEEDVTCEGYRYKFGIVKEYLIERNNTFDVIKDVSFGKLWVSEPLNDFYLRTFLVSNENYNPFSMAYPNAVLTKINSIISFDYRSVNGSSRPDVGSLSRRPTDLISEGYQYFNTDEHKPQWFTGEDWIIPLFGDFNELAADRWISLSADATHHINLRDLPVGKYRWSSANIAQYIDDWPTNVQTSAGFLFVIPAWGNVRHLVLFTGTTNIIARSRSDLDTWGLFAPVTAGNTRSSLLQISGVCIFDTTIGKPIWWNGTAWVDATGQTV